MAENLKSYNEQLGPKSGPYSAETAGPAQGPGGTIAPACAPPQGAQWYRLPAGLRERRQWCLAGADKAPVFVGPDGKLHMASSTDPTTWADFESVCRAAEVRGLHIGYVLTANDPFSCIDLDVKDAENAPDKPEAWTTSAQLARYGSIVTEFNSYTELSRGGKGVHVWVLGNIGNGVRRDGVEVYSQERFIICTGQVTNDRPIQGGGENLTNLVSQMRPLAQSAEPLGDGAEVEGDDEVLARARAAENAPKFNAHYAGDFKAIGHDDHSRADMALIQMLAHYTLNNAQLKRLFLSSALGQRKKATDRRDYVDRTIKAVRALQAAGPNTEHGREIAFNILASALTKHLAPAPRIAPLMLEESGMSILQRLAVDWTDEADAEVPDIVTGLVADEDVTLLGGHGGIGKSFLAIQIGGAVAVGGKVLGHTTRRCRVLYYSAEDGRKRLMRRLRGMAESYDNNLDLLRQNLCVVDASELEPLYGEQTADGKRFAQMLGPKADFANLQKMVEAFDPQLVIIDGASDTFDGDEIRRREVRAFVKMLRRVHPHRKVGVLLLVHIDRSSARGHSTNDDGYAGNTQWHNSCRRRLFLQRKVEKEKDEVVSDQIFLRVMKNQDGTPEPDMELIQGLHGLWQPAVQFGGTLAQKDETDHGLALLSLIGEYYAKGSYISTSLAPQATTGAYAMLNGDPRFPRGLTRKRTEELVRHLERDGRIRKEEYKRANRGTGERWVVTLRPDVT